VVSESDFLIRLTRLFLPGNASSARFDFSYAPIKRRHGCEDKKGVPNQSPAPP
jgi:hypothetical protein